MHCAGIKVSKLSKRNSYRGLDHYLRNLFFDTTGHSIDQKILLMLIAVPVSMKYFCFCLRPRQHKEMHHLSTAISFYASVCVHANRNADVLYNARNGDSVNENVMNKVKMLCKYSKYLSTIITGAGKHDNCWRER